jgi:hypothetical protein
MPETVKSQSIPISGVNRTASELQLCEDEAIAEYRDYIVFSRIVNGISRQQEQRHSMYLRHENDKCLAHIVSTRTGQCNNNNTIQSLSEHVAQGMTLASDDYFLGEDPESDLPNQITEPVSEDTSAEDEGIFTLEL